MKSFTGIIFWSILLICSACTDENETNNGKRTDCYNGQQPGLKTFPVPKSLPHVLL